MRLYIGIDPGLTGAVAVIDSDGRALVVHDTPSTVVERSGRKRSEYLVREMAALLDQAVFIGPSAKPLILVVLEHQQAFPGRRHEKCRTCGSTGPGQGSVSSFLTGRGFGIWEGIIGALKFPVDEPTPAHWKPAVGIPNKSDKEASRVRALKMFPEMGEQLSRKKDHGRAEALLLAEFGRRITEGGKR